MLSIIHDMYAKSDSESFAMQIFGYQITTENQSEANMQ